jgi:uncharacterized membrane protein YphA (DoxX/SURF4 family)
MENRVKPISWPKLMPAMLVVIRMAIGWHLLYEGISKLMAPAWSSYNFLMMSRWILGDFFKWMAQHSGALAVADFLNIWGLIFIGIALVFGVFTRMAAASGVLLLSLYYIANPPFIGLEYGVPSEGSYLIVNKNLIELLVLVVFIVLPSAMVPGIDRLWKYLKQKREERKSGPAPADKALPGDPVGRREVLLNLAALPVFGGFAIAALRKKGWMSYEQKFLKETDAVTSATIKTFDFTTLKKLQEKVPTTRIIGGMEISRVILGGNLVGGWAHARELIYVDKLVKSYHTDEKVYATFRLAEDCGINTFLTNPVLSRVISGYWRRGIGKIQFISDCGGSDILQGIRMSVDNGASACYVHGGFADRFVMNGQTDKIREALELIRQNKLPAGIGAHKLSTVKACVEAGLKPDFWMKTLHGDSFLTVKYELEPGRVTRNDDVMYHNVFCEKAEDTVAYMSALKEPWIAFKVLAAGAIEPAAGFRYAFENGADFICVGMYDFQIVDDVNIAMSVLKSDFQGKRPRPWLA